MVGKIGAFGARMGAKLLFAVALVAIAIQLTGAPATTSATSIAQPDLPTRPAKQAAAIPASAPSDQGFVVKRILEIDGPLNHGDYVWNDGGVPAGPIVITVDLAAQTLSVFRAGYEIGTAVILYGAGDKPSPLGAFSITEKDPDHVSNLYNAAMPYMLRLTDDGVAIHGSEVEWGAATHGCVGVPTAFASLLFAQARLGDRVLITNGETLHLGERIPAV
jgi:hypothetical protein